MPAPRVPDRAWVRPLIWAGLIVGVLLVALLLLFLPSDQASTELTTEELAALIADPPLASDPPPLWTTPSRPSDLNLTTNPAGAAVQLNNEWIGTTPVELDGIQPGFYTLRIAKPDHVPRDTAFYLASGSSLSLDIPLRLRESPPVVASPEGEPPRPPRSADETPRRLQQQGRPAGGGTPSTDFAVASPEQVRQVTHTGSLSITSNPSGAIVLLDGVVMGRAPLSLSDLSPGSYVVTLTLPSIVPLSYQAEVTAQSVAVVKGDFSVLVEN